MVWISHVDVDDDDNFLRPKEQSRFVPLLRAKTKLEFKQIHAQLSKPLDNETDLQRKQAEIILEERSKSYFEREPSIFDGEVRVGTSLVLREDLFSYAYVHMLKSRVVTGKD